MHQAVYMCMFQGAMDQEMVIHWSRHGRGRKTQEGPTRD